MNCWRTTVALVKISRPGFWLTALWFYLLPFAQQDMFSSVGFWLGATYVCFPLGLLIYGWNDLTDTQTDALNPRKDSWLFGARPDDQMIHRLPWLILLVQAPFLVAFVVIAGAKMFFWFALVLLTNATYNWLNFKQQPFLDILNQAGYVLVFVLASWLCDMPQLNAPAMIFSALFAMISHIFGQLMDVEPDRLAGRRSTAVYLGVRPAKVLLISMMLVESVIAWKFFSGWYVGVLMLAGATFFIFDTIFGPDRYPMWFNKAFFIGWNVVVLLTMHLIWKFGVFQLSDLT
jgi:4-hydroxybenzoate polyprenyltransferase